MDTKNNNVASPGEATKLLSIEDIRRMVKMDTNAALLLLDAIYRDQSTLEAISDYLHGRYMNAKHKEDLEKQTKLDV